MAPAENSRFLSGSELARLCSVSPAAVTQALKQGRLIRDPVSKKYDRKNSTNQAFIEGALSKPLTVTAEIIPSENLHAFSPETLESMAALALRKAKADADRTEEAARKLRVENALKDKTVILREDAARAFGALYFAIKTNLITAGRRVARGDTELQIRIDNEIKRGIENAKKTAQKEVERILGKIKEEQL